MSDNKNKKKSPFSIYWIYAAIGVAIIGVQLFMSSGSETEIDSQKVVIELWEQDFIDEMVIVNRDRLDFTLTKEGRDHVKKSEEARFKKMRDALILEHLRSFLVLRCQTFAVATPWSVKLDNKLVV